VAVVGVTAALYFVLTVPFGVLSYGDIQFRFAEVLNLLAFVNPVFAPGVILGCFVSNIFSPFAAVDMVVGTLHTAIVMFAIVKTKQLWLACLWPVLLCVIIAVEVMILYIGPPYSIAGFITVTATVLFGEAVVMFAIGFPLFKYGILKNERLVEFIKSL
jgi:uncharacterized membrane protein